MKKFLNKFMTCKVIVVLILILQTVSFISCSDDEDIQSKPMTINKVFLEDANSVVRDREVTFIRKGQTMRLEGSGFLGVKKIFINGYQSYFNTVFVTDNSILVSVFKDTPIIDADPTVRNTIRLVKDNTEIVYKISVRDASPNIISISHTMPQAGEKITLYGTGLTEINKVVFPGNVIVTTDIVSDVKGTYIEVTVPAGVSNDGGAIFVEGSNGGGYSPSYFNYKKGLLLNFDGVGSHGYWNTTSMIRDTDIESAGIGLINASQGKYAPHRPSKTASFPAAKNRNSEVWTSGSEDWRALLTPSIPAITKLNEIAFQFDIYVPEDWTESGFLKICLSNNFNGGEFSGACYNYVPWIINGDIVPFKTQGWTTITIPLNKFYAYTTKDVTFEAILAYRETAAYKNFGIYFENSDLKLKDVTGSSSDTEFASKATSVKVYTDNWRIVPITKPVYSDYSN